MEYNEETVSALLRGEDMEPNEKELHEQYVKQIEDHLSKASKELLKEIVRNNKLKYQIEFLIDRIRDIDFVLHGEGARNINWYEISKAAAYSAEEKLHEYQWGEHVEIYNQTDWIEAIFIGKDCDGGFRTVLKNGIVFVVPEHEIRPLKED